MDYLDNIQSLKQHSNKIFLSIIGVLFVIILIMAFGGENEEVSAEPGIGLTVSSKTGDVFFSGNGEIWEFADNETVLEEGFSLKTSDDAKAILKTPEGSILRLNENTELKVIELNKKQVLLTQNAGKIYHRVEDGDYQVNALGHTIEAIGTAFEVSANQEANRINVKVLDGKVEMLINTNKLKVKKTIEAGEEITIDPTKDKVASATDIRPDYIESDWFVWNKEEDEKNDYSLSIADDILASKDEEEEVVEPAKTSITSTSKTTTTTSTPAKTTTTTTKTTTSTGSCYPSLSAKKSTQFGGIKLNWATCSSDDFQFYKVVRSTLNSSPRYPSDSVILSSSNRSYGSYLDKTLTHGRTYYYRVCVVERLGKVSCGNVASSAY